MAGVEDSYKNILYRIFEDIEKKSDEFVMHPGRDFSRKRKLPFAEMMRTISIMEGNSLNKELCDIHNFNDNCPFITRSAFVQQRAKIKHEAFKTAFDIFNMKTSMNDLSLFEGYRLIAIDGSAINIALNKDSDTHFGAACSPSGKGYNQFHLNAMFDLLNNTYLDCVIQPGPKEHEIEAARTMVKRLPRASYHSIIIADRGYNSFDLMETIRDSNSDFLFRIPETFTTEISSLPLKELDTNLSFTIVTEQTKETKKLRDQGKVKFIPGPSKFGKTKKNVSWFHPSPYTMSIRVVRLLLSSGSYETIATSLDPIRFPPEKIKKLYHLRWGIETSFRTLKYAIGITNFHAKKEESIKQEIFARLLMFNFCSRIAHSVIIEQKDANTYMYKINYTQAIHICFAFLKKQLKIDIRNLIRQYIEPVRPGREDQRKIRPKSAIFFNYRVA